MVKKNIIAYSLLIYGISTFAQMNTENVMATMGEIYKVPRNVYMTKIIMHDETGIYAMQNKSWWARYFNAYGENSLLLFDNNMNLTKTVPINMDYQGSKRKFEYIVNMDGNMILFSSFKNKEEKKNYLFIQSINKSSLVPNDDLKKIAEIDYSGQVNSNAGNFNFKLSMKKSKILIYYNMPYEKRENEKYGFMVFDSSMNKIWGSDITLPYNEKLFLVWGYLLDEVGNVHILGKVYNDVLRTKRKNKPNYTYHVLSYFGKGKELREYKIDMEEKFIANMKIAVNHEQDLICAGFYYEENSVGVIGSFFQKIDLETRLLVSKNIKEFDFSLITQYQSEKKVKKTEKKRKKGKNEGLRNYYFDEIIVKEDGGTLLVGEQYYEYEVYLNDQGVKKNNQYFIYNDIIVVKINNDGEIEWASRIPKRQNSLNDGGFYLSYHLSVYKDNLMFLFNDDKNNLTNSDYYGRNVFGKYKRGVLVKTTVDANGTQKKQPILSYKEAKALTRPKIAYQISENEVLLFTRRIKKCRLIKVTIN